MSDLKINKAATIKNILDKINRSVGSSVNMKKINEKKDNQGLLGKAAEFLGVLVVYI